METLKKICDFMQSTFIYSNNELFDDDFLKLLQIFYFFGYYRPTPSTKRTIHGLLVFLFIQIAFLLGEAEDSLVALSEGNQIRVLISATEFSLMISYIAQNLTFITRQSQIVELVKNLQSLHEDEDDGLLDEYKKKCTRLVKFYLVYIRISATTVILAGFFGYGHYKLILPALYDAFAEGYLYYPLFFINALQIYCIGMIAVPSDLLHILCIVRVGANFEVLGNKLRRCADSESSVDNEKDLTACVKYHWAIIEETKKIQEIFSEYFMSKAYGTVFAMSCFMYVLLKSDIRENMFLFLVGIIGVGVTLFQFGTLCFFGEWMTGKATDLLDASYDCKWFNQSKSFKKTLMIFRFMCQKDVKIGTIKFDFSHESFYRMNSNAYYYYNNLSQSVDSIEKKSI